jgi:hypothetical protein
LPSPPSWVPKYVDIWCPECHPCSLPCIVQCSSLFSDRLRTFKNDLYTNILASRN